MISANQALKEHILHVLHKIKAVQAPLAVKHLLGFFLYGLESQELVKLSLLLPKYLKALAYSFKDLNEYLLQINFKRFLQVKRSCHSIVFEIQQNKVRESNHLYLLSFWYQVFRLKIFTVTFLRRLLSLKFSLLRWLCNKTFSKCITKTMQNWLHFWCLKCLQLAPWSHHFIFFSQVCISHALYDRSKITSKSGKSSKV